jgi:hypothetical protein
VYVASTAVYIGEIDFLDLGWMKVIFSTHRRNLGVLPAGSTGRE